MAILWPKAANHDKKDDRTTLLGVPFMRHIAMNLHTVLILVNYYKFYNLVLYNLFSNVKLLDFEIEYSFFIY